jgi:hypothetical protein
MAGVQVGRSNSFLIMELVVAIYTALNSKIGCSIQYSVC